MNQGQAISENSIIRGDRVELRLITPEDTENILKWRNSRHVMENFLIRTPLTREIHENWLQNTIAAGKAIQYIIHCRESGRDIGSQYFHHMDPEKRSAEYGIFIGDPEATGKGYGTEVLRLALDNARDNLHLKQVTLKVLFDNTRARGIYERAGFKTEFQEKM